MSITMNLWISSGLCRLILNNELTRVAIISYHCHWKVSFTLLH
jgi:hypothetical protein